MHHKTLRSKIAYKWSSIILYRTTYFFASNVTSNDNLWFIALNSCTLSSNFLQGQT